MTLHSLFLWWLGWQSPGVRLEAVKLGVRQVPLPCCMTWDQMLKAVFAHRLRELNSWLLRVGEEWGREFGIDMSTLL